MPRRARWKFIAVTLAWAMVAATAGWTLGQALDWSTEKNRVRHGKSIDEEVEKEGPAFSATVRLDTSPADGAHILATTFSAEEVRKLVSFDRRNASDEAAYQSMLRKHGEEYMAYPGWDAPGLSKIWLIDFFADRSIGLSIVGMRAKGLQCQPARSKGVIKNQNEGGGSFEGMLFDLAQSPDTPIITGEEEPNIGKPFFSYKKIDLGNAATPGGLRVEVTSGFDDCAWDAFEVKYADADGVHTQDVGNESGKFSVLGIPRHPTQFIVAYSGAPYFRDCTSQLYGEKCGYPQDSSSGALSG